MRLYFIIVILLPILFSNCNSSQKQLENGSNSLLYEIKIVKSESLLVRAKLKGIISPQKLELELEFSNLTERKIQVKEIIISTSDGLRSTPVNFDQKTLVLSTDTTLSFTFNPVNDILLYRNTEMPGILKSTYNLSIVYTIAGKKEARAIDLVAQLPAEKYQEYEKEYKVPVTTYKFNTINGFSKKQRVYLENQKLPGTSPFVHLSDQEIAVSGLNFRLQSYQKGDSLFAKILLVNHSDFPVKIDTAKLDFIFDDVINTGSLKNIILNKVTGSKEEYDILRKGDRIIISLRRYKKDVTEGKVIIAFKNSFILPSGNSLFYDDMELVKVSEI